MATNNISEDIEVLSKKLLKDPASRLFLPLAEKYRDAGMLEEAESTLRDGLKHHPDYVGAQFSLGRVLHEKGDTDGAFGIFREVVRAAPDNLLAHKKLSEIALKKGLVAEAVDSLRMIVELSPRDEGARELLERYATPSAVAHHAPGGHGDAEVGTGPELETFGEPETAPAPPQLDESSYLSGPDFAEMMASPSSEPPQTDSTPELDLLGEAAEEEASVDLAEFASETAALTEQATPEPLLDDLMAETSTTETGVDLGELALGIEGEEESASPAVDDTEQQMTLPQEEEIEPAPAMVTPGIAEEDTGNAYELPTVEEIELDRDLGIEVPTTLTPVENQPEPEYTWGSPEQLTAGENLEQEEPAAEYEIVEEEALSSPTGTIAPPPPDENLQQLFSEIAGSDAVHETPQEGQPEEEAEIETETMAELYIQQGHYDKARDIYTRLLDGSPDNSDLRQKLEEVQFMINLLNQKDRP